MWSLKQRRCLGGRWSSSKWIRWTRGSVIAQRATATLCCLLCQARTASRSSAGDRRAPPSCLSSGASSSEARPSSRTQHTPSFRLVLRYVPCCAFGIAFNLSVVSLFLIVLFFTLSNYCISPFYPIYFRNLFIVFLNYIQVCCSCNLTLIMAPSNYYYFYITFSFNWVFEIGGGQCLFWNHFHFSIDFYF